MKAIGLNIVATGFLLVSGLLQVQARDVFFAGGQSNATEAWGNAIEAGLVASGKFDNPLVVHVNHDGAPLQDWFSSGQPQMHYSNDLFNASGTGVLEAALNSRDDFKGFFWFQGEHDAAYNWGGLYGQRFTNMLSRLQSDLGLAEPISFTLAVIDIEPTHPSYNETYLNTLCSAQLALGALATGAHYDTRGYPRADGVHLSEADRAVVGQGMGAAFISAFPDAHHVAGLVSHWGFEEADGATVACNAGP